MQQPFSLKAHFAPFSVRCLLRAEAHRVQGLALCSNAGAPGGGEGGRESEAVGDS